MPMRERPAGRCPVRDRRTWAPVLRSRLALVTAVLVIGPAVVPLGAQAPPPAGEAPAPLHLDPAAREVLKGTMREHLEALQAVVAALARGDYERAAATTHEELGFPKHHEVMRREGGAAFPQRYRELAMAHHRAAEDLARAITAREMAPILQRLDGTLRACVACHRAFRLGEP